jgi:hypothetical protein
VGRAGVHRTFNFLHLILSNPLAVFDRLGKRVVLPTLRSEEVTKEVALDVDVMGKHVEAE